MDNNYKNIQAWLIVFIVVILIGLCSTVSLIFYSSMDRGTPVSEPIALENAEVTLLQDEYHNVIKLDFNYIVSEKTENYTLYLLSESGKKLETVEHNPINITTIKTINHACIFL